MKATWITSENEQKVIAKINKNMGNVAIYDVAGSERVKQNSHFTWKDSLILECRKKLVINGLMCGLMCPEV
jgi:hypothetical protein